MAAVCERCFDTGRSNRAVMVIVTDVCYRPAPLDSADETWAPILGLNKSVGIRHVSD